MLNCDINLTIAGWNDIAPDKVPIKFTEFIDVVMEIEGPIKLLILLCTALLETHLECSMVDLKKETLGLKDECVNLPTTNMEEPDRGPN
jgi:hypothetical protein